jgi:chorismate synthase
MEFLTAGESHGEKLVAILEGCPAGLSLSPNDINPDLGRRQQGYGRGERMAIELDKAKIVSGVLKGSTIGAPIAIEIANKGRLEQSAALSPRPGHADLSGFQKFGFDDIRPVIERASARETAARVAIGAIAKKLLGEFKVDISSSIVEIGGSRKAADWKKLIDEAKKYGNTLGGIFELRAEGVVPGVGGYSQGEKRLGSQIAAAIMSIPAIKGVEIGLGFESARLKGSQVHDEIIMKKGMLYRKTNNAGGLEGGMTNGEPIIIRAAMKPIATLKKPLASVNIKTGKKVSALVERGDTCAVEAAAVVGEAMLSFALANAYLEKFGHDTLIDIMEAFKAYLKRI